MPSRGNRTHNVGVSGPHSDQLGSPARARLRVLPNGAEAGTLLFCKGFGVKSQPNLLRQSTAHRHPGSQMPRRTLELPGTLPRREGKKTALTATERLHGSLHRPDNPTEAVTPRITIHSFFLDIFTPGIGVTSSTLLADGCSGPTRRPVAPFHK